MFNLFWNFAVLVETQASFSPENALGEEYAGISSEQAQQMIDSITPEVVLLVLSFHSHKVAKILEILSECVCYGTSSNCHLQHNSFLIESNFNCLRMKSVWKF